MADDLQQDIDDIIDALSDNSEGKITRENLEKELKKFLDYGVPIDHAKQTLIKKFGGEYTPSSGERTLIVDLEPNQSSVTILARVISINPKDITIKGEERKIYFGILGDESGTIPFTAWKDFEIEKGDILEISNAYTREWQGDTKINLGDRTKILQTDESKLPEMNLEPKEYKIKDLRSGLGAIEVTVMILETNERDVEIDGQKKKVYSGIIGDETGKAQYTAWHDFKIKKGDVLKISGGYIKSWKGIPQLTFDEKATITKIDNSTLSKQEITTQKLQLYQLVERNGALDIEIEGTVIRIREGSGIVLRCPDCNRVLQDDNCSIHGKVSGTIDLRVKLDIDDGTGTVAAILGKQLTEKLLATTIKELQKNSDSSTDQQSINELINKILFAHRIRLRGNALGDEFGITLIAKDAEIADIDIKAESEKLSEELEEF